MKKPEAALAYSRIYADAVAGAAEGAPDFVEQIQLATAEYNARLMVTLPENLRGPMLTYLEDLQIATMRSAEQHQTAADIALRARQADNAAKAWTILRKRVLTICRKSAYRFETSSPDSNSNRRPRRDSNTRWSTRWWAQRS